MRARTLLGGLIALAVMMASAAPAAHAGDNWLNPNKGTTAKPSRKERCKAATEQLRGRGGEKATVADLAAVDVLSWECGREGQAIVQAFTKKPAR